MLQSTLIKLWSYVEQEQNKRSSLCLQEVEYNFVPMYSNQTTCSFELYGSDATAVQFVDLSEGSTVMRKVADLVLQIPIMPGVAQRSRSMVLKLAFGRAEIGVSARDKATGRTVQATAKFASIWLSSWQFCQDALFAWLLVNLSGRMPASGMHILLSMLRSDCVSQQLSTPGVMLCKAHLPVDS